MTDHLLKIHPKPWSLLMEGRKPFEIRRNDRGFQVGDLVAFEEWDPESQAYTGWRSSWRRITVVYTHEDMPEALQPGWCVFAHEPFRA